MCMQQKYEQNASPSTIACLSIEAHLYIYPFNYMFALSEKKNVLFIIIHTRF